VIGHLWKRHRWLLIGFVAMVALTAFFVVRTVLSTLYWSDHRDETIAGWMTPRYVAMSWQVPPEVVGEALSLERDGSGRRSTLAELAATRGVSVEALAAEVAQAIETYRAGE
jgi:hypothetical protein